MGERKFFNYIVYWKNRILSFPFGDTEQTAPNKILMAKLREELLSLPIIYQKIPFEHFRNFPFYRDPTERLNLIIKNEKNLDGKKILDLGSSLGFYCFSLSQLGANCVGIEADKKSVNICNLIKKLYSIKNTKFMNSFISPQKINQVGKVDFTIFFSTFHHIIGDINYDPTPYGLKFRKGIEYGNLLLSAISLNSKKLYFEMGTPFDKGSWSDRDFWRKVLNFMLPNPVSYIEDLLSNHFKKIEIIRKLDMTKKGQERRPIFLCKS